LRIIKQAYKPTIRLQRTIEDTYGVKAIQRSIMNLVTK